MATTATRTWVCPKLCGCEFSITAQWVQEQAETGGKSYQHPIPFTITHLSIVSVCAEHDALRTTPIPADPYGGSPGYIRCPIENPSDAQRLYVHLYRYAGQRVRPDTCRCQMYACVDRVTGEETIRQHVRHSVKCSEHPTDDDQHTNARENRTRKNRLLTRIAAALPGVVESDIHWQFTPGTRQLVLTIDTATTQQKAAVQTWCDTNLGAGRVLIA